MRRKACVVVPSSLADLYDAWHEAEPDQGYDTKAAEWRTKLEQWQATTRPATTQPATVPAPSAPGTAPTE